MKTAVVYYSLTGNTEYAAGLIAKELGADLIRIAPKKEYPKKGLGKFFHGGKDAAFEKTPSLLPYDFDADEYDTVVLATPVWASSITPPMRTFVTENKEKLAEKRIALLLCFLGGGDDKASGKLKALLGIEGFSAELTLLDPLNKPSPDKDAAIKEFCSKLK